MQRAGWQELAASGLYSEETHVPRQSAAGEINLAMELQGPVGKSWGLPVSTGNGLTFPDKVRLVK
jgi:hypothetical protein